MSTSAVLREPGTVRPGHDLVDGRLDAVRLELRSLVAAGARDLVVDLTGVRMVDSVGIGLLVSARNSALAAGGALTVVGASPDLQELFAKMRLDQLFRIEGAGEGGDHGGSR